MRGVLADDIRQAVSRRMKNSVELDVTYVGNDGLEITGPCFSFVHPEAASLRDSVDCMSWDLEAVFEMVRTIAVQRNILSTTVHLGESPADLRMWIDATVAR